MDASIMNGKDLSAGAVSAVRCVANPIKLARLVMEKVRVVEAAFPEKPSLLALLALLAYGPGCEQCWHRYSKHTQRRAYIIGFSWISHGVHPVG